MGREIQLRRNANITSKILKLKVNTMNNTALQTQTQSLLPQSFSEMMQFAEMISKSSMCPKALKGDPGSILVCIQAGMEVSIAPFASLNAFAIINGKPSLYGDALLAVCQGSGAMESFSESFDENNMIATCEVKRRGYPLSVETFSMADAKKAGLWGKSGPWSQYPKRMLTMRARGFNLRNNFADKLAGVCSAEEQRDIVEPQHTIREVVQPKTTVSKLLEKGKTDESPKPIEIVEQPKEDKRTIFDHERFEEMREYFTEDPEKMILITRQKTLEDVSNLPIKFFDAIITGMEAGK